MESYRRSPETPRVSGTPDAGQALHEAIAFLPKLIPFPGSESVGPLPLLPMPAPGSAAQADTVSGAKAIVGEPAASVVSQAASILDEEMAKGVLAARSAAGTAPQSYSNEGHPALRPVHEFVDNLAALWPRLQGGVAKGPTTGGRDPRPQWTGMVPATRSHGMMQEAIRLAEDGELGNSDAIRLLQIPHRPEEVQEVLAKFERQLTREAKSKLTLEAFAPLPEGVDNQRFEPIFDRYPITGRTYKTAAGAVVLNEIQYYNGEMVQLYGECPNVAAVRKTLEGSGYKPLTIRQTDGQESAIAQFWSHQLSDTSLRPYNAAFVILAAVPEHTPGGQASIAGDKNGMSSALAILDGMFDPATAVFENRARLFCVRLLDSTQIAIDVGRERMGTDKRPGTIEIMRQGRQRSFSVRDGRGNPVAKVDFVISDDPRGGLPDVARAAATAGMQFRAFPRGTEYVYPCVARIESEPVVCWQWRTDVAPRLQRAESNAATFDSRSEEGELLVRWGFTPKVVAYIPNVRGVISGLP